MQTGFAFLECGSVRSKNTTNILIKNMLDAFIGGISYWAFGYALAFGEGNAFIGGTYFFGVSQPDSRFPEWFFQFVFAATSSTIVSGALAERCDFAAYLIYSFIITGFIYPVVSHWAWSPDGWLAMGDGDAHYQDFAGSGVVHLLGGVCSMVGAKLMGPRIGRFDSETGQPKTIRGHNIPLAALGGFILLFGFLAFNGGSQLRISGSLDDDAVALAIVNTVLAGSFAAFTGLICNRMGFMVGNSNWSLLITLNCCLTGMVSISAGCNALNPWAASLVGSGAALVFMYMSYMVLYHFRIDDPLDAISVHGGGGLWGVLMRPILQRNVGIVYTWNTLSFKNFGWNVCGVVAIATWCTSLCTIMFSALKCGKRLRVAPDVELRGLDIPKHGEPSYPVQSYGHGWDNPSDNRSSENLPVTWYLSQLDNKLYPVAENGAAVAETNHVEQEATDQPQEDNAGGGKSQQDNENNKISVVEQREPSHITNTVTHSNDSGSNATLARGNGPAALKTWSEIPEVISVNDNTV